MSKIQLLPEHISSKIAAGEVVQRPESVIKELLENALDAGAGKIDLILRKAGKHLIQVIDDGEGMTEEDVLLSVQKHATSKIKHYEDLDKLYTYGFRGEALSAIMAVAQLEIKSKRATDELGTILKSDDSSSIQLTKDSCPQGTSVAVKNLFYNVPARRNFLKADQTEFKHSYETFLKAALSRPDVHFGLYQDDEILFEFPKSDLVERIEAAFPTVPGDGLFKIEELTDYISLEGYIGKPYLARRGKAEQYLFVNKRFVNSKLVNHAVFSAFENILEKSEYPFFVLYLTVNPAKFDINIHPSKLDIRFENEQDIYRFVQAAVKKALGSHDLVPVINFKDNFSPVSSFRVDNTFSTPRNDFSDRPAFTSQYTPERKSPLSGDEINALFSGLSGITGQHNRSENQPLPFEPTVPSAQVQAGETMEKKPGVTTYTVERGVLDPNPFVIQLHGKYILTQIRSGLMIIDQHAAHERILYEKALDQLKSNSTWTQPLLLPITMTVDPAIYGLIKEMEPMLNTLGFELSFLGKHTISITGIPQDIPAGTEEKTLLEIVDEFVNNRKVKKITDDIDNLSKSFACKSAIKTGDKLTEKEMTSLIDQLFATRVPYSCPHGRPIVLKVTLEEFDRRFGRT